MPHIIDTNQNGQNIGLQIQHILLNTGIHIHAAVTADTTVKALILTRIVKSDLTGSHRNITVT